MFQQKKQRAYLRKPDYSAFFCIHFYALDQGWIACLFFLPEEGREVEVLTFENIGIFAFEAPARHRIERKFALGAGGLDAEFDLLGIGLRFGGFFCALGRCGGFRLGRGRGFRLPGCGRCRLKEFEARGFGGIGGRA